MLNIKSKDDLFFNKMEKKRDSLLMSFKIKNETKKFVSIKFEMNCSM